VTGGMQDPAAQDGAAARVGARAPAAAAGGGSCPGWCAEQVRHGLSGGHVHCSDGREVPVTRHWWCHDMNGDGTDLDCAAEEGVVAFLTMTEDDGVTEVVLRHGNMELPHFSLQAAEELAGHLLRLVRDAR
jgi:hypothetical protein